jgi:uncharacterized protein (TIGR03032 family)
VRRSPLAGEHPVQLPLHPGGPLELRAPLASPLHQHHRPGRSRHLNGLAVSEDGAAPAYVTALAPCDVERGWRERKRDGGCLISVASGEILLEGLSMPHSPRVYHGQLYLLDSGHGRLLCCDPITGSSEVIATLPGFTRGLG